MIVQKSQSMGAAATPDAPASLRFVAPVAVTTLQTGMFKLVGRALLRRLNDALQEVPAA